MEKIFGIIRRPKPKKEWTLFTGRILQIPSPIIAVLGTDGACGKRTTVMILDKGLQKRRFRTAFVQRGRKMHSKSTEPLCKWSRLVKSSQKLV